MAYQRKSGDSILFRDLNDTEEEHFRDWARRHPKEETREYDHKLLHPVIHDEWERIEARIKLLSGGVSKGE